ncbi:MinD/ParA family ATP-binding protein [Kitasatospora mediocidica]|uniref:MinD/ParA family ATP-binding protein n=1 Tax=Kitasatospora mediocidica TaxID=58352 RepID=UPI00068A8938|nr:MinD/ParA family protein [Kitasatospora mediocidica]
MAGTGGGAPTVQRLDPEADWHLAPNYTPAHRVPTARRSAPAVTTPPRPDWTEPLDALGTILVPPEARLGSCRAEPAGPPVPMVPAVPPVPALPPRPAAAPLAAERLPRRRFPALGSGFGSGFGSGGEQERMLKLAAVRTPLNRCYRIAVIGLSSGIGTTSATLALGSTLAAERPDRVVAVDANPAGAAGALGRRTHGSTGATLADLHAAAASITDHRDIRRFTAQGAGGLEVLAHPDDDGLGPLDPVVYRQVIDLLSTQYPVVLSDCGAGLSPQALRGVLDVTDQVVVTADTSVDGAAGAGGVLDGLVANGYGELALRAVTVVRDLGGGGRRVGADRLVEHFGARCRGVVVLPFDDRLTAGAEFEPARLRSRTRRAWLDLAALVGQDMARAQQRGGAWCPPLG